MTELEKIKNIEELKESVKYKEYCKQVELFLNSYNLANQVSRASIDESLDSDQGALLFHYTNIQALANGLLVKEPEENKEISLWATDTRYLNDQTEITLGSKIVQELLNQKLGVGLKIEEIFSQSKHYTISFSEEGDSIPMWSTYGNKGDGIALGLDKKVLKSTLTNVYPCLYSKEEVISVMERFYNIVKNEAQMKKVNEDQCIRFCHANLATVLPCIIKHIAYKYEKEYRFIYSNFFLSEEIKFRYANNLIIPYIIKYLPRKALKKIIIGPNLNPERTKMSIVWYLASLGFYNVEIEQSKVPFRNL